MTKPLPNWAIWLHMPTLTTHQAICLSFGIDPAKVYAYDHDGKRWGWRSHNQYFCEIPGFVDRRTLFTACQREGLSILKLSKWAQSVGWNIPIELARLAPVPVDAPDTLPTETVRAALLEVIALGADIEEVQKEISRAGITFTMRDGVETVEIPDGNVRGRREPLSGLYVELVTIFNKMPKGSKLGTLLRASGATGSGALGSNYRPAAPMTIRPARTTAAPEPQAATPSPAPVATVGASGDAEGWKKKAQERAHEIIKRDRQRDLFPSQKNLAEKIAEEFRRDGVMGADGKPLAWASIKRHALIGISSAQGKQLSTAIGRGK